jgi:DNA repair protein RecO
MINKHYKDEIIILKRFCINENDLLVTGFGKLSGKIQLKAKGSKKLLSKFTGRLEPLSLIQAEIYNSGKSHTLTNVSLKYDNLFQFDLETFNLSQNICMILNKNIPFEEPHTQLFSLIEELIQSLCSKTNSRKKAEIFFLTKFLKYNGILPCFIKCHSCHQKFSNSAYFQNQQIICHNCNKNTDNKIQINTIKLINYINNLKKVEELTRIKVPININLESLKILNNLLSQSF